MQNMDTYRELTAAQRKFESGDSLTDNDLKILERYYKTLSNTLGTCYMPEYNLFKVDVWQKLDRIEGYIKARKEKPVALFQRS